MNRFLSILAIPCLGLANAQTFTKEFLLEVQRGKVPGYEFIEKFGRNGDIGATIEPVCDGGNYRTPKPSDAVTLELICADADDTAAGAGAREVTMHYLDALGDRQVAVVPTNGLTVSATTVPGVFRLYRLYVSSSGTYANQSTPSQQGEITVRVAGGGDVWATIPLADTAFGAGQSLIGAFSVPRGYSAYIKAKKVFVDATKSTDLFFFKRDDILDETAPFTPLRIQNEYIGLKAPFPVGEQPWSRFGELTDIGFMAKSSGGGADASVEFDVLLVKEAQ